MSTEPVNDLVALLRTCGEGRCVVDRTELECRFVPPGNLLWTRIAAVCFVDKVQCTIEAKRTYAGAPLSERERERRMELHRGSSYVSCRTQDTAKKVHISLVNCAREWMQSRASNDPVEWSLFEPFVAKDDA